ncbi:MAG TPA: hypothetical protein VIY47_04295, partial [Ignavibacteriaceae bacterium]
SREKHVRPVSIDYGTVFTGNDFNVDPMTAVIGQYDGWEFRIADEVYLNNSDTYKMGHALIEKKYKGAKIIPDSTAGNRKTSGKSDLQILKDLEFSIESTRNPFVTDRVNNLNRLFTENRIVIDPKCKKLINDLEKVSWKNNELDQSGTNKHLTHISDALGYLCWKLCPISLEKGSVRQEKIR